MSNWISVEDNLPPTEDCGVESVIVLASTIDGAVVTAFMEDVKDLKSWTDEKRFCEFDIAHWMPLPEPPKQPS